ncbi:methyltransferase domain-containing protein [Bradyrhizobium sp. 62]|uniref:methyltransferase domain-containing protein n=1 Tax=Bradyrhizobium sp. 62 TaxID=1043588 RepID=UPI001FFA83FC|nr:methyltransferase domain-containing protein [Bradyrhizobium sp. 62]MCK1364146.1 methyltransferase domain-containing protein [Bradyrhizobium sp. 62]
MNISGLVCPITKRPLTALSGDHLAVADGTISYPVKDDIPILLGPEAVTEQAPWSRNLRAPQYDEAYKEMEFYNLAGYEHAKQIRETGSLDTSDSAALRHLGSIAKLSEAERGPFPDSDLWYCETIDVAAERDCYRHIGSVRGKRVIQIGGKGSVAVLLLLAGAAESILLTPMHGEASVANALASLLGLEDRLRCIVGIAEEIPIEDSYLDVCYVGGCVHHMRTEIAFLEIARILKPGGKFAAIEPWRAPGYTWGTKIFGKREPNAYCSPLDKARVSPIFRAFSNAECIQHGTLTRYPSIVAQKAGIVLSVPQATWVADIDDAICNCIPFARKLGSGVALLATK